jgi:hypothetical protein
MAIALLISGAALAALCIWLAVRVINRRERWAKWMLAGIVIGLPGLYVGSFGPACWVTANEEQSAHLPLIYWPIGASVPSERTIWGDFVFWWGKLGIPYGHSVWVPMSSEGTGFFRLN